MKRKNTCLRATVAILLLCLLSTTILCSCVGGRELLSATVNEAGELILSYSDGTTENVGVVKGADGEKGEAGPAGADGADGLDGRDGADGEKGEPGQDGQNGLHGANGVDGKDGANGRDGVTTIIPATDTVSAVSAKALRSTVSIVAAFSGGQMAGSGVIWQMDGHGNALIITNHHVVYSASTYTNGGISNDIAVYLYGAEYKQLGIEATYVGGSMYYDIAVLQIEASDTLKDSDAVPVTVADSEPVRVGDQAIAVGNPKGIGLSSTLGIVSVDSEILPMTVASGEQVPMRVMRIDAGVNSGNSGGGLYNDEGELCGIVNAKIVSEDVENMGYAIPSNLAVAVAQNIVDHGVRYVKQINHGLTIALLDSYATLDESGYMKIVEKVAVGKIEEESPFYGRLSVGDEILSVTLGEKTVEVTRSHHVTDLWPDVRVGDTLTFTVKRDGVETPVTVTLAVNEAHMMPY